MEVLPTKKRYKTIVALMGVVVFASLYGKEIAKFLFPSFSVYQIKVIEEAFQLAVVLIFIIISRSFHKIGIINKINKQSLYLLLPIILLSFIPLLKGVVVKRPYELIYFFIFCICIGFTEELVFRGVLYTELTQWGKMNAVVFSSVLFGLIHISNLFKGKSIDDTLLQIVFAIGFGIVMAVVRYKTDLLLPQVIVHALWDFNSKLSSKGDHTVVDILVLISVGVVLLWAIFLAWRLGKETRLHKKVNYT